MGYSKRCKDLKRRWDGTKCVMCTFQPGREITPNCGYDDEGGRHEVSTTQCKPSTFNDGSRAYCQPCTLCPPGYNTVSPCNLRTDTQCHDSRNRTTDVLVTETTPSQSVSVFFSSTSATNQGSSSRPTVYPHTTPHALWTVPLAILISIVLVVLCVIYMKRKRGQHTVLSYSRRSPYINAGFSSLSAPPNNELEDILSPPILSASLQTVLDNLDVLEELVILLDPETHGVKNTKHLASYCSFPSTWITYTYSLRDSKSPLKAVLEGVTSRHPDWTVGHLAKFLQHMERNDAIAVLAKLRLNEMNV